MRAPQLNRIGPRIHVHGASTVVQGWIERVAA